MRAYLRPERNTSLQGDDALGVNTSCMAASARISFYSLPLKYSINNCIQKNCYQLSCCIHKISYNKIVVNYSVEHHIALSEGRFFLRKFRMYTRNSLLGLPIKSSAGFTSYACSLFYRRTLARIPVKRSVTETGRLNCLAPRQVFSLLNFSSSCLQRLLLWQN